MAAHTIIVADPTIPPVIPSTQADVMAAAYYCAEAAVRLIKPGNTNTMVTEAIAAISSAFGVTPVQGVLMHELKRHIIDSSKTILLRGDDPEIKVNEVTFELNQVWHIDVLLSTGEGKPREAETRTTIFKLVPENEYRPKMNAAQNTQREATKKFAFMPFTLRALENKSEARLGITELIKHGVVSPYPVLYERTGVQLAHFGFTVLLMPNGTLKLTGLPLLESIPNTTTKVLPDSIKALLQTVPYTKPVKATTQ